MFIGELRLVGCENPAYPGWERRVEHGRAWQPHSTLSISPLQNPEPAAYLVTATVPSSFSHLLGLYRRTHQQCAEHPVYQRRDDYLRD